ncbi:recombinase family protein [Clostridium sp.]|jgi:site-specific DNA recombinase|uniref:recombinase family protein n=1 Tax=Clostridium sp. TaxID=1506 RepID=UPI003EE96A85
MNNEHDIYKLIKFVAIYLRKSRGDESTDLEKHRSILVELCKKHNWKYVQYEEIKSGDSLALRPEINRLLNDVRGGLYDAVVIVDFDRLSRGDSGDQDTIKKALQKNGTLIVTPNNIYNLNNDDDEFRVDIEGLFARQEYKKIKRRMQQGKKIGARQGDWTNGPPPYPYQYQTGKENLSEKGLVVNKDKLRIYRTMVDMALKNVPSNQIAFNLNRLSILSPRGLKWSPVTVDRILKDETHLGNIISNKGIGNSHSKRSPNAKEYKKILEKNGL